MARKYIKELGDKKSHGVAATEGDRVKTIAPVYYMPSDSSSDSDVKGIQTELDKKEDKTNKTTSVREASSASDTLYPTEKAVATALADKATKQVRLIFTLPVAPSGGTSVKYVKITGTGSGYRQWLCSYNGNSGDRHSAWLFRSYATGEGARDNVTLITNGSTSNRPWYCSAANTWYVKFTNTATSSSYQIVFNVAAIDTSTLPTLEAVDTMPDTATEITVYGVPKAEQLRTARQLAVSLSNTGTTTTFDGSANVTNIKVSGTLGVGNGGTGKASVTAGNYLVGNGSSALTEKTPAQVLSDIGAQAALSFDGTYNASSNKVATVSTVTNAVNALDVSSVGGAGKYISSISETDGKISATATTMDTTPTASSTNAVTSGGVKTELDNRIDRYDAVYNRNNIAGDGWVKLADVTFSNTKQVDKPFVWDVMISKCTGATSTEQLTLNVRYNLSGLPDVYFRRYYTVDRTSTHQFAVVTYEPGGLASSANGKVELWAYLEKFWGSIGIREIAGSQSTALYGQNKVIANYYSYTSEGGTTKPVADLENNIQVIDSTNIKLASSDDITTAINALDVSSVGGDGKYIKSISETNGKISATVETMDTTPTASSTKAVTSGGVKTALDGKVSSIIKNGSTITPSSGAVDIGYMPTTYGAPTGTVQEVIQALRVRPGGSQGSVAIHVSTIGTVEIPAAWYNYIWLPHQTGRATGDYQQYGTLLLTPLTTAPKMYLIEGQSLHTDSPTYRAKILAYSDHTHGNITNGGALQTTDVTIANGDKLVITDASDSNKVARASIAFDGTSTNKVLTQKGTFEDISGIDFDRYYLENTSKDDYKDNSRYYQHIDIDLPSYLSCIKLYDVTEFYDGTINQSSGDHSMFDGTITAVRVSGAPFDCMAHVTAHVGYNGSYVLASDNASLRPVIIKENFEQRTFTNDAWNIELGAALLSSFDTSRTDTMCCADTLNAGDTYYINVSAPSNLKAWGFATESGGTLVYTQVSDSNRYAGIFVAPENGTLVFQTAKATNVNFIACGKLTDTPKYYLGVLYTANVMGCVFSFTGRFKTRQTDSTGNPVIHARPLLLDGIHNMGAQSTSLPDGYEIYRDTTYYVRAASALKITNARQLAVSLSNTTTNTTFDGSANVTNIKTTGTLGIPNGGTGKTNANDAANALLSALPAWTADPTDSVKLIRRDTGGSAAFGQVTFLTVWNYMKGKMTSDTGVNISGNAATATKATQDSDGNDINTTYLKQLYQAEYGVSTFADIYAAITAKKTVYCKVPGAGASTSRMAFLAYMNVSNPPTSSSFIEFQYYRSDSSGAGDSVFVYTITNNNNTWTTVERAADTKVKATAKTTDNANYKILATASASPTSGAVTEAVYDTDITLNPSTNTITANVSGNATTASAAQTGSDLETAINNKANDDDVVHKAGEEVITGRKIFQESVALSQYDSGENGYNAKCLGDLSITHDLYSDWPSEDQDGHHYREWEIVVPYSVSFGEIRVTLTSVLGVLQRTIRVDTCATAVGLLGKQNYPDSLGGNNGYYTIADNDIASDFRISDLLWDSSLTETYKFVIKIRSMHPERDVSIGSVILEVIGASTHFDDAYILSNDPQRVTGDTYEVYRYGFPNGSSVSGEIKETVSWLETPKIQNSLGKDILVDGDIVQSSNNGSLSVLGTDVEVYSHPTQTAYTSKGTATKVPQITTDSTGHVTSISEVTISGVTPSSHASTATTYGIGTTSNYGHVKLATGDMNGATNTDGVAVSKNHTHSQYAPVASPTLTGTPKAPTAASGTNTTQIATTAFVQDAVTQGLAVSDAMVYKGTVTLGASSPGGLTVAADKGHTYKVIANGTTTSGYVDGVKVEAGDMVICNSDSTAAATSSNYATIAAKWDFVQGNTDGVVVGPASATSGNVVLFDGATGKLVKDGGTLGTAAFKNVASSGNASTTQVVMGNDSRLTDSRTPTDHSHGNITNGGALQTTDITIANGDKLVVTDASNSNKVARSSLAFDATTTNQFLSKYGTFRYMLTADAKWGGKFTNALSPGDTYFFMQRNCFFGAKASAISVEYSTDGGTTWIDYGLTNDQKISLFSQYGGSGAYCGKNTHIHSGYTGSISGTKDLTDDIISNQRLRITIARQALSTEGSTSTTDGWMYCNLRRIGVFMSSQSANASGGYSHCVFSGYKRTDFRAGNNNWIVFGDYKVAGDSGWNSIPCNNESSANGSITFGSSFDSNYVAIRFEFWCDKLSASPNASQTGNMLINRITGFSELIWSNSSVNPNMANTGMPCSVSPTTGMATFSYGIKFTGRKLAVSLSNTSTDTTFDGSADVTNIKTTGTLGIPNGGTGKTSAPAAEYALLSKMGTDLSANAILDNYRFVFASTSPSESNGRLAGYRTASSVWNWVKGNMASDTGVNISGNAATASAAQSGSALETAINAKQNALTINDSKPITIGTAAAANTVTGQAHTHDGITSIARASVTNIDITNSGTEPARMTLSQVTSATTQGTDPGDGYVFNLLWDNNGNWDTQLYVPNSKNADKDYGHLKLRFKNESSTWGEWEYLPGAFKGTLLTSNDDLDTLYQGLPGEVIQYYWSYTNKAYSTVGKTQSGMDATTGLPTGTGTANLFVFHQSTSRTASGYVAQLMFCADIGIYYRRQFNGTWNTWTKILVATDITTDTTNKNGKITVDGTDKTVYVHPAGSAASKTGVPTANATPAFGGTFKVNQITTDATSHVSAVTERTITIPNTTGNASTAGLTKLYTATGTNTDGTMTQNAIKSALDAKMSSTVSEDASNELQVVGVQSSATSTLKRDSGVTVQGGAVKATTFKLGTNATITYNATTEAIDFTFL